MSAEVAVAVWFAIIVEAVVIVGAISLKARFHAWRHAQHAADLSG
ncbi:MAG TPA: hypothetical protein VF292_03210 [Rhodanobacteraceae bacterium]